MEGGGHGRLSAANADVGFAGVSCSPVAELTDGTGCIDWIRVAELFGCGLLAGSRVDDVPGALCASSRVLEDHGFACLDAGNRVDDAEALVGSMLARLVLDEVGDRMSVFFGTVR